MVGTFLSSEKEGTISLKGSLDEAQAIAPTAPKISLLKPLWPPLNPVGNYNEENRRIARQITKKSVWQFYYLAIIFSFPFSNSLFEVFRKMSEDCIFCKIIAREIPSAIFYEDEHIIAFLDAFPAVEGHSLVVPKQHTESFRNSPAEVLQVAEVLPKLASAVVSTIKAEGVNILCNDGRIAGQIVPHIHFHIVPRKSDDGLKIHAPQQQGDMNQLRILAEKFGQALH